MPSVAENLRRLKEAIASVATRCGRDPSEITLVAVTKLATVEDIREAYETGHRDFGENYWQKVAPKMAALPADIRWHFIGEVQKNKINKLLGRFVLIHSIDSFKIADALELRAAREGIVQDVLIEVKTSPEATKHGINPEDALALGEHIVKKCPHVKLCGLMTMAPFTDDRSVIAGCFEKLRLLRDQMLAQNIPAKHLSMGMTNDWEIAIEYGATILRIGTAIFGAR